MDRRLRTWPFEGLGRPWVRSGILGAFERTEKKLTLLPDGHWVFGGIVKSRLVFIKGRVSWLKVVFEWGAVGWRKCQGCRSPSTCPIGAGRCGVIGNGIPALVGGGAGADGLEFVAVARGGGQRLEWGGSTVGTASCPAWVSGWG